MVASIIVSCTGFVTLIGHEISENLRVRCFIRRLPEYNHSEPGRFYSEKELNSIIMRYFDDYCTIRREMVDLGMMQRNQEAYWVPGEAKT